MTLNPSDIRVITLNAGFTSPPFAFKREPGIVSVFVAEIDTWGDDGGPLRRSLSEQENLRANGYHRPIDRMRFVGRRGLLRHLLAGYLDRSPEQIQFENNTNGKPCAAEAHGTLDFSLSHSDGLAVYAFSDAYTVGIDLEKFDPGLHCSDLARHFFTPSETARITSLDGDRQLDAFLTCWTRKEAYIKLFGPRPLDCIDTLWPREALQTPARAYEFIDLNIAADYQCTLGLSSRNCCP